MKTLSWCSIVFWLSILFLFESINAQCNGPPQSWVASDSGFVAHMDYANNEKCIWIVTFNQANSVVALSSELFVLEENYDILSIFNGATNQLIRSFGGTEGPNFVLATPIILVFNFTSDSSNINWGFNISYTVVPNNLLTTSNYSVRYCWTYTLASPSGFFGRRPSYYLAEECSYLISVIGAANITLSFTNFDTQNTTDFVRVYAGSSLAAPLVGAYSGALSNFNITLNVSTVFVTFVSSASVRYKNGGFLCYYEANIPQTFLHASGNFARLNYSNNENIAWYFLPPLNLNAITFTFTSFVTERDSDFVNIFFGQGISGTPAFSFSGNLSAPFSTTVYLAVNGATVQFISDYAKSFSGFSASFQWTYSTGLTTSRLTTAPVTTILMTSGLITTNTVTTGAYTTGAYTTNSVTTGGGTTSLVTTGAYIITTNLVTTGGPVTSGRSLTSGDITTSPLTSGDITTNEVTTLGYSTTSVEICGITVASCVDACGAGKVVKCLCENGGPVILCDTTASNSGKLIVGVSLIVLALFAAMQV